VDGVQQRFPVDGKLGGLQPMLSGQEEGKLAAQPTGQVAEAADARGEVFFLDHGSPLLAGMVPA